MKTFKRSRKKRQVPGKNVINIVGNKYGYLTVIAYNRYNKEEHITYWDCLCDCGNTSTVKRKNLISSKYPSCGCKLKEIRRKAASKSKGEASFNEVYRRYKYHAKNKNLKFELSKEQFRNLTSKDCFYCNSKPNTSSNIHKKRHNGVYVYNGIDRKNNNKGYVKNNCVPCCEVCNRMKLCLSFLGFKNHIRKIYKTIGEK